MDESMDKREQPFDTSDFKLINVKVRKWKHFQDKWSEILEVNLFTFAYRLFHADFSPLDGMLLQIS